MQIKERDLFYLHEKKKKIIIIRTTDINMLIIVKYNNKYTKKQLPHMEN
jgi:hypothetical protein